MKLPSADAAIVDDAKVRDYLLSDEHRVGRFKARIFNAAGYRDNWRQLQRDLLATALSADFEYAGENEFGTLFVGSSTLSTPTGAALRIATVWIIPTDGTPRFVTAYPQRLKWRARWRLR